MQNIGAAFAMLPGLKAVCPDNTDEALNRYIKFFNTQPYMAPTAIGISLNLEEAGRPDLVGKVIPSVTSSLAALGDTFFWATLKPIMALVCIVLLMLNFSHGIVLVYLAYNIVHLLIMVSGFNKGYEKGPEGAIDIGKAISLKRTSLTSYLIPLLSGIIIGLASGLHETAINLPMAVVSLIVFTVLTKLKINVFYIFYGVFTIMILWAIIT